MSVVDVAKRVRLGRTDMCEEAIDAIKALDKAGSPSFITCESGGGDKPRVVAKFSTVEEAQAFHRALIQCGEAARYMEAVEKAVRS